MEPAFLTERLERFLEMVLVPFKVADKIKKSPKGFSCTLERDKSKPAPTKEELKEQMEERAALAKKEKKAKKKAKAENTVLPPKETPETEETKETEKSPESEEVKTKE